MDEEVKIENFETIPTDENQLPEVQTIDANLEYEQPHAPIRKKRETLKRDNTLNQPVGEGWPSSQMDEIHINVEAERFIQPVIAVLFPILILTFSSLILSPFLYSISLPLLSMIN